MDPLYFVLRVLHDWTTVLTAGLWLFGTLFGGATPGRSLGTERYETVLAAAAVLLLVLRTVALAAVLADPPVTVGAVAATLIDYLSQTDVGRIVATRLLLGAILVCTLLTTRNVLLVAVLLILFVGFRGLEGHAMAQDGWPFVLHAAGAMLHQLAIAGWIGMLLPLLVTLTSSNLATTENQKHVVQKFGHVAAGLVGVLIIAGVVLALLIVRTPEVLWTEDYGRWLVTKLFVFGVLLSLAAVNRWGLTPRLSRSPMAWRALKLSVTAELVLGAWVIALALVMSSTHPPHD